MSFFQGAKMFSADSKGIVIIWNSYIHAQVDTKRKRKGTGGKKILQMLSKVRTNVSELFPKISEDSEGLWSLPNTSEEGPKNLCLFINKFKDDFLGKKEILIVRQQESNLLPAK